MKKEVLIVLVIFLFLINIYIVSSQDKVDNAVEEKLISQDKVNVIVVLKDSQIKSISKKSVFVKQLSVKEQVLGNLNTKEFDKKRDFSIVNGFSGEINKEGLEKLKLDENVEKIIIDKPIHAFLTESVPLINATLVHNLQLNEINLTGDGQTICLVDTGVNSSHSDLIGKVVVEKCYCQVRSINCCPDGGNEESGDGSALDDYGHGTQMAGIISANGNLKGVALDAKIAAVKVLDSSGTGEPSDLISGIEWCINNRELYNITIISLSLGGEENYYSYCDNDRPDYAAVINSATNVNISVFAASGNDANDTAISAPACIENSISVGAVYDADMGINWTDVPCLDSAKHADDITCFTNRNSILSLLAPGALITSTDYDGNYKTGGGTSQATPHAAGSAALLLQYFRLEKNLILTPQEVKTILNNTGVGIYDDESNNTFSRVDAYEAVKEYDDAAPRITISLTSDVLEYNQENLTININYEDVFLDSYNANVSYPNGSLLNGFTTNLNLTSDNLNELGSYTITAWANDTNGNEDLVSKTFLVQDTTSLNESSFNLIYPDDMNLSNGLILFNVTIGAKYNLSNASLYYNATGWSALSENLTLDTNETSVEFNPSLSDGTYLWGVQACDIYNNCAFSANRTIIVDNTDPVVSLYSPNNSSSITALPIDFIFNVTDYGIDNCVLVLNGKNNETLNPVSLTSSNVFTEDIYYLPNGNYNWSVNCIDKVGKSFMPDVFGFSLSCSSDWSRNCSAWSDCSGGSKTRLCYDANYCSSSSYNQSSSSDCSSSSSNNGGSSPGGEATTTSLTESVLIFSGLANDVKSFGISKDVGIEGVSVTLVNAVTDAKLTVKKLDSNPTSSNLNNVYNYIQIDKSGLTNEDIKEAVIKFKVDKNWINTNAAGVNYVYMQRYNNGVWEKLETLTAGADDNYQKYEANTPGFSYFAINAEKPSNIITTNAVKEETNKEEIITESISNVTNKSKSWSFKNLFSSNVIKNLTDKISFKNIISKKTVYNVIFVAVIFLMLVGVTYRYRGVILKNVRRKGKSKIKFTHKDYGIKKTFFVFGEHAKEVEKREIGSIVNGIKKLEEAKNDKLNEFRVNRLAKLKLRQEEDAIKSKTREEERSLRLKQEENEKVVKLKKQDEERMAKETARRAKEEKYEIKERNDKNEFDIDSDWDEGD